MMPLEMLGGPRDGDWLPRRGTERVGDEHLDCRRRGDDEVISVYRFDGAVWRHWRTFRGRAGECDGCFGSYGIGGKDL